MNPWQPELSGALTPQSGTHVRLRAHACELCVSVCERQLVVWEPSYT